MTQPTANTASFSNDVALVDQSYKGLLLLKGKDGLDLLHRLSTNDLSGMRNERVAQTIFTTEKGRLVDIVDVIRLDEANVTIVTSSAEPLVMNWIMRFVIMEDVEISNVSESTAHLSLFGSYAPDIAQQLGLIEGVIKQLSDLPGTPLVYHTTLIETQRISFLVQKSYADDLEKWLLSRSPRISKESVATHEHWRIVKGIPAFGKEITTDYNPYEVNLSEVINFAKGCYVGQEVIARLDTYDKVQKQLVKISFKGVLTKQSLPTLLFYNGLEIGALTSVSPLLADDFQCALGVIRKNSVLDGETVYAIDDSGNQVTGAVSLAQVQPPRSAAKRTSIRI